MKQGASFGIGLICVLAAAALAGCRSSDPRPADPPEQDEVYELRILRHTSTPLADRHADQIVGDMGVILRNVDGAGDVACDVDFRRVGNVGTFSIGDGIIASEADFQAVIDLPGEVKVVRQIHWCGTLSPNIIGCAPIGGDSFVVVRFATGQEGILWAHELGHNRGLQHRSAEGALMNAFIDPTHRRVNSRECRAYEQGP